MRYLEKPALSEHPLAGKTFDYLGFQTQQQLIGELYVDDRIAFDYDNETVSFDRQLYSWDFEAIQQTVTGELLPTDTIMQQIEMASVETLKPHIGDRFIMKGKSKQAITAAVFIACASLRRMRSLNGQTMSVKMIGPHYTRIAELTP